MLLLNARVGGGQIIASDRKALSENHIEVLLLTRIIVTTEDLYNCWQFELTAIELTLVQIDCNLK